MQKITVYLVLFITLSFQFGISGVIQKSDLQKPGVVGATIKMDINNIDLGFSNAGDYGLEGQAYYPIGSGQSFLYSGGLGVSGYDLNDTLRVSWVIASSRLHDFQPGLWGMDPDDPKAIFYLVNKGDGFGSVNYVNWADAVALGADFVDLNNDGSYDPNVDMPDLLGDKTIWCVYNDGVPQMNRKLPDSKPNGISVFQSVFAFERNDELGNIIFIRYRIRNDSGGDLKDVIFSAINDPDLGYYGDDLIGCDTTLSLGFIYNDGQDAIYGSSVPAYGVDFLQGPIVDSPGDTAYRFFGPLKGMEKLPDKKNLPMTSFMYYIQSHPTFGDPNSAIEARRYMEGGLDKDGNPIDPVNLPFGVGGTSSDNPKYLFSGDPVAGTGWLDATPDDKRFMLSTGPFMLKKDDIQDIVIGLVIGQGKDALESVTRLKEIDQIVQSIYNNNFDEVTSINDHEKLTNVTENFVLYQNYPNPFNPVTTIQLYLPVPGDISLKVYNELGREVATLWKGYKEAGYHSFNFNGNTLPSGIYFYTLKTNSKTITRKMILMK